MRARIGFPIAAAALAFALVAASCGDNGSSSSSSATTAVAGTTASNSTVAPETTAATATTTSTEPVTITLLTHDSFATSKGLLDQFTAQTGITVKVLQAGDAGEMVNQAILTKGKPLGDALFGVDNTFLSRAVTAGIFVPYASPALADVAPEFQQISPDHSVTPIDFGDVCVNYDKAYFAKNNLTPPTTLEDLAKPEYKGLLAVENPSTSSPGLVFLLATVAHFGDSGWQTYWKSLKDNGVKVDDTWEQAYSTDFSGSTGKGPKPLVVSYASSPPAEVIAVDPPLTDAPTGVSTGTCFRQIEFAGVLAGTSHEQAAEKLIDFMLSTTFQNDMPLQMYVFPVNTKATLPDAFQKFAVIPQQSLTLDPAKITADRDKDIKAWTSVVLG